MADNGVVTAGGRLTDWVSLGVLAAFVPRDAVDDAVAAAGKRAERSDGKLPPHVMVYLVMALALFADDDYEEVAARLTECASHAAMGAVAGKDAGEQSLARKLYRRLDEDWLLIADRNFFSWADWCRAADTGAQLLWRVKSGLTLPVLALLADGSYSSVLVNPKVRGKAREALLEAASAVCCARNHRK